MTPTQIVHELCGSPVVDECLEASGVCYVCAGQVKRGKPVADWMGSNYTDQNRVASPFADFTCESCCFVMSRTSPVPGRPPKDGKQFGGNFRNYSHLWELGWEAPVFGDDGTKLPTYANASKGQKPLIRAFIDRHHDGPWFAAIADSGQKHVLTYDPINPPGKVGMVLFEEALVKVPADTSVIAALCSLLTDGATKEELERGEYRPQTWQRIGTARLREFERVHGCKRGHWFALALWLAQRDEDQVAERLAAEKAASDAKKQQEKEDAREAKQRSKPAKSATTEKPRRAARKLPGRDDGSVPGRVPESVQRAPTDVLLGPDRKPDEVGGTDQLNSGRVGDGGAARAASRGPQQLGLFGDH